MAITTQEIGLHSWKIASGPHPTADLCGVCPDCGKQGEHKHTEFSGGDGEIGYVEYECWECGIWWTDEYRLVTRTVFRTEPEIPVFRFKK